MPNSHIIDNLRHGADVYSSDTEKLGRLHAVVVDPANNEVTHVSVNTGPNFPEIDFGDPEIVSVDMDQVLDANEERVVLSITRDRFDRLPLYEKAHFFSVPDAPPADTGTLGRLWNTGVAVAQALASLGTGIAVPVEHFRKATFERHILNDAPVWRVEPNTHMGFVERILVDEATDEIEAFVIKRSLLFQEDVVLPMQYVTEIRDGLIHVQISDEQVEALQEFHAA